MFLLSLILSATLASADGVPQPGQPGAPTPPPPGVVFDYKQEGMYSLQVSCTPTPNACNSALMQQLNRLSIVDSQSELGIWVMLASDSPSTVIDSFYAAQIGPTVDEITAAPRAGSGSGKFSYVNFTIDPVSGNLSGVLYDYESSGHMILQGKAMSRVADLVASTPPLGVLVDSIFGTYTGSIDGIVGTLRVGITPANSIFGFFSSDTTADGQPTFSISFDGGAWTGNSDLMQLTFENPRFFAEGGLNLVVKTIGPTFSLQGLFINGFASGVSVFTKG